MRYSTAAQAGFQVVLNLNNTISAYLYFTDGADVNVSTTATVNQNAWNFFVFSHNSLGKTISFYLNNDAGVTSSAYCKDAKYRDGKFGRWCLSKRHISIYGQDRAIYDVESTGRASDTDRSATNGTVQRRQRPCLRRVYGINHDSIATVTRNRHTHHHAT